MFSWFFGDDEQLAVFLDSFVLSGVEHVVQPDRNRSSHSLVACNPVKTVFCEGKHYRLS